MEEERLEDLDLDVFHEHEEMPNELNIHLENASLKERHSNLKFNFIELETQQNFLEHLSNSEWRHLIEPKSVQEKKNALSISKARIKKRKAELASMRDHVSELVDNLHDNLEEFKSLQKSLRDLRGTVEIENIEFSNQRYSLDERLQINDMNTVDECLAVIDHSQKEVARLALDIEKTQNEIANLDEQLRTTQQGLHEAPQSVEHGKVEKSLDRLKKIEGLYERFLGWKVSQISEDGTIMVALSKRFSILVKVGVEEGFGGLMDIQLIDRTGMENFDVEEIIATAIDEQNLEFALREIELKLMNSNVL